MKKPLLDRKRILLAVGYRHVRIVALNGTSHVRLFGEHPDGIVDCFIGTASANVDTRALRNFRSDALKKFHRRSRT